MEISIIGFPKAGKTTVFNALTRGHAATAAYTTGSLKPNIGVVKVPDPRLQSLAAMFQPESVVPAEVQYADIPGLPEGFGAGIGIHGELLNLLQRADALLHVVRAFPDPAVPWPSAVKSPEEAAQGMGMELAVVDLGILERRVSRLEAMEKGARPQERAALHQERAFLSRVREALERDVPVGAQEFSPEERKFLGSYQFLTAKPLLMVLNLGEQDAQEAVGREKVFQERLGRPGMGFVALDGKLEAELAELTEKEEEEFRRSLGLETSGRERVVRASYALVGLISFLTAGPQEVRAWSIPRATPAARAAGRIHSDMERGFIRAEVVAFDDLAQCGGMAEARKRGLLRQEGKEYPVNDGDVITFLFNV
jgi:hypothetical protein